MKVAPCSDQTIKILSITEDVTSDDKNFKRVSVEISNYIRTSNGRIRIDQSVNTVYFWEDLYSNFPEILVGDIIEGESVKVTDYNVNDFFLR